MKSQLSLIVLLFLTVVATAQPSATKRVALVIGVQAYTAVPPLQHSLNDARDMAAVLKTKGFQVLEVYHPRTKRDIKDAVLKYFELLRGSSGAAGLLYYSGHGMQVDGSNYLIPTSANPQIKADLEEECLRMDYVMEALEQTGNPLNILIMDACRNNPFRGFSRGTEKGLNVVNAPKGSYIVYATKPGSVASDGTGRNGLFTSKLLKHIQEPNLNLWEVFQRVARDVSEESDEAQRPWISSDYTGDFYFNPGIVTAGVAIKTPEVTQSSAARPDNKALTVTDYRNASDTKPGSNWFNTGVTALDDYKYDEALVAFDSAIKVNSNYAEAYAKRGAAKRGLKKYPEAIADFDKAIQLKPRNAEFYCGRSKAKQFAKQKESALADVNFAIELEPNSAEAYDQRASLYGSMSMYDEGILDYTKELQLTDTADLKYNRLMQIRGVFKMYVGKYEGAIADYSYILLHSKSSRLINQIYSYRGMVYLFMKRPKDAIKDFDTSIEQAPESSTFMYRGQAYRLLGKEDLAILDFNKAIESENEQIKKYPKRGYGYCIIGASEYELGHYEKAISSLNTGIEIIPNYSIAYITRGETLSKMGKFDEAAIDFKKAVELDANEMRVIKANKEFNDMMKRNGK